MANKYYYNGKLVRTSDHIYTHAVLTDKGEVTACRPSYEKAYSVITSDISKAQREIENDVRGIHARQKGMSSYYVMEGRTKIWIDFSRYSNLTIEFFENHIKVLEAEIERLGKFKVVELERR